MKKLSKNVAHIVCSFQLLCRRHLTQGNEYRKTWHRPWREAGNSIIGGLETINSWMAPIPAGDPNVVDSIIRYTQFIQNFSFFFLNKSRVENIPNVWCLFCVREETFWALSWALTAGLGTTYHCIKVFRKHAIQVWKKASVCICGDKIAPVCSDCGWLGRPAGSGYLSGSSTHFCYSKIHVSRKTWWWDVAYSLRQSWYVLLIGTEQDWSVKDCKKSGSLCDMTIRSSNRKGKSKINTLKSTRELCYC